MNDDSGPYTADQRVTYEAWLRSSLRDMLKRYEIPFTYHDHPDSLYDFSLPVSGARRPICFYVVLEAVPGVREEDVARLLSQGNQVLVLNREDLVQLSRTPGPAWPGS